MDEQQTQRINEAAKEFSDALAASYRALTNRTVSTQEQSAQLTQEFFNNVNERLRTHAEENRQLTQELADQSKRQQEAGKQIAQESVDAYVEFMTSMFSFAQGAAQEGAKKNKK